MADQKHETQAKGVQEEEEDDYMSMVIAEPEIKDRETSIKRRARKEREAEIRSRPKTKEELKLEESAAKEKALDSNSLDASSKGFQMMAKLGFKPGETLGKSTQGRKEPIRPVLKEDRGGIGLEAEKKRKIREEWEVEAKKVKTEQGDYRERMRLEREERRLEVQFFAAQKVAEKFDTETEDDIDPAAAEGGKKKMHKTLKSVNILWRGLLRSQIQRERERRMRHDLQQSLSRLPTYEDVEEEREDAMAVGKGDNSEVVEEEVEEDDQELDEFNALPPQERLQKIVLYLRDTYFYCFWCKYQYKEDSLDECPGILEEDHD